MTDLDISVSFLKTYYGQLKNAENRQKAKVLNSIFLMYNDICDSNNCISKFENELNFDTIYQLIEESKISDICLEIVGNIFHLFLKHSLFEEYVDIYLVPFVNRCVFKKDGANSSEENRLQLIRLLRLYFIKRSFEVLKYRQEMIVNLLLRSLQDTYPAVLKETCSCFIDLDFNLIKLFLSTHSDAFVALVSKMFIHRQYKVRISCVNAINAIAFHADLKVIQSIFPHLAQCLLDQVPQVRLCITQVLGNWMVVLPNRHSLWDRLISLFFASFSDEIPEIHCLAFKLWFEAGKQHAKELDNNFDKQLLNENLFSCPYIKTEYQNLPLGCQELARKNFGKLLPAIKNDFGDWMNEVKFKASQVLYNLIINANNGITPHAVQLLDSLIVGCKISDENTLNSVKASIKLTGYFVNSSIWSPIIVKWIEDNPTLENVRILEYLLRGSQRIELSSLSSIINLLAELIVFDNNNGLLKMDYDNLAVGYKEIIIFCADLLMGFDNWQGEESFNFFFIFTTVYGTDSTLHEQSVFCLEKLSECLNIKPINCLWNHFGKELIKKIESLTPCDMWKADSVEWKIFILFIAEIDYILYLKEVKRVLKIIATTEKNYVMKFYCLKLMTNLFENKDAGKLIPETFFTFCLKDIIFLNMIWHSGCTASSVRTAATTALYILIKNFRLEKMDAILLNETFAQLLNLFEDDSILTRELVCRTLDCLIETYSKILNFDHYFKAINFLLGRMNDSEVVIRVLSCKCLGSCLNKWHEIEKFELHSTCFENIIKILFVYFHDDDNQQLQLETFNILKCLSKSNHDSKLIEKFFAELKESRTSKSINEFVSEFKNITTLR